MILGTEEVKEEEDDIVKEEILDLRHIYRTHRVLTFGLSCLGYKNFKPIGGGIHHIIDKIRVYRVIDCSEFSTRTLLVCTEFPNKCVFELVINYHLLSKYFSCR